MRTPAILALVLLVAGSARALDVNVVEASQSGCSPDAWTSPDLRVVVRVNGEVALETAKGQDTAEPYWAAIGSVGASAGARIAIEIHEAEPGGFFGLGTTWVLCDAAPGPDMVLNMTWNGAVTEVVAEGDGARAARAVVVLGPNGPAAPKVTVKAGTHAANLTWDADPAGRATGHRLASGLYAAPARDLGAGGGTIELAPLCDNMDYTYRVIRDADPWHVAGVAQFRTANAPPPAPTVVRADVADGNVSVSWHTDAHDLERVEVHAGPAGFAVSAGSRRGVAEGPVLSSSLTFPRASQDAEVVVRAIDTGGLSSTSERFRIGDAPRPAGGGSSAGCRPTFGAARSVPTNLTPPPPADDRRTIDVRTPEDFDLPPRTSTDEGGAPSPTSAAAPPPAPSGVGWGAVALALVAGLAIGALIALARRR